MEVDNRERSDGDDGLGNTDATFQDDFRIRSGFVYNGNKFRNETSKGDLIHSNTQNKTRCMIVHRQMGDRWLKVVPFSTKSHVNRIRRGRQHKGLDDARFVLAMRYPP